MSKRIAVINQKGGVGKTTSVANLAAAVAARGHDVLLIDLDPQSHLTLHLGVEPGASPHSIYDVLTTDLPVADALVEVREHLRMLPAVIDLAAAEVEIASAVGREQILKDKLDAWDDPCEFVMMDCPPSLGLLTLNALAAADEVIIPLQPHFLALQGLGKLMETVSLVQRRINPRLHVSGVILCMYETGTRLAGEVVADLRGFLDASRGQHTPWGRTHVFEACIRRNIKLAECPSHGVTIFEYEPASRGAEDYNQLAEEFLALCRGELPGQEQPADAPQDEPAADDEPHRPDAPAPASEEAAAAWRTDAPADDDNDGDTHADASDDGDNDADDGDGDAPAAGEAPSAPDEACLDTQR